MQKFSYKGRTADGQLQEAEIEAVSEKKVFEDLREKGVQLIEIKRVSKIKKVESVKSLRQSDIILFTEELGELMSAGLPLEPALASMEKRGDGSALKTVAGDLRKSISDGIATHSALKKISPKFDLLYCNLVAAGEVSGSLASIITQHGIYLKQQQELKNKLITALIYPFMLLFACLGVGVLFIFYLMPQMSGLLKSISKGNLPLGVQIAEWIREVITNQWGWIILVLFLLVVAVKVIFSQESQLKKIDQVKLNLPFVGKIFALGFYVQWLQTLSNLIQNEVPLAKSLELTQLTIENRYCKEKLTIILDRVKDGMKLTSSMKSSQLFPENMIDLIAVSDHIGRLDETLQRTSVYFSKQLEKQIKVFLAFFSVVILLCMALLVAGFTYTLLQAIYGSMENMG